MTELPTTSDLMARLRAGTTARVGLGRVGCGLPTAAMLDFQLAHARARDAVHAELAYGEFAPEIAGLPVVELCSAAPDRQTYLMRPDLGRQLAADEAQRLSAYRCDLAIVIADGLSAAAVRSHGARLVEEILARAGGWNTEAIVVAHQARVALGDEIGEALGAEIVVVLIGERPGLSAADSVGAYITWAPRHGRTDSERNCISNIRPPHGLGLADAADLIMQVVTGACALQGSGVSLKISTTPGERAEGLIDAGTAILPGQIIADN